MVERSDRDPELAESGDSSGSGYLRARSATRTRVKTSLKRRLNLRENLSIPRQVSPECTLQRPLKLLRKFLVVHLRLRRLSIFSATEDSIARQATEAATERSVSTEPDTLRERARELRTKAARPSASKPSPSVSEEQIEEKPPVEKRVKPPPKATSAKAKTKRELVEAGDIVREAGVEETSRAREGERSSASGIRRSLEDIPTPPPAPTKEEIEQAEAARQLELQNLPPPPPAPRVPPVPATARAASKPQLTERIQPVVLAPRPKERPPHPDQATPSTSARPAEPRGDPPVWQDKPLVLFHKTLSFPNSDPPIAEASVQTLKGLKEKGFAVGALSFASNKATQESVATGVADLERRLGWSLDVFAITRTKFSTDAEQGASITGHIGCKAKLVAQFGPIIYVDDQGSLLNDVRTLQQNVPLGSKTHCVYALQRFRGGAVDPDISEYERTALRTGARLHLQPVKKTEVKHCW